MSLCFVIQPFDKGRFDKRYVDVFKPAILEAGLDPYRVDEDPGVEIPIESIEQKIRASYVCLADITLDNPNVWYELGFAFALNKPVVLVCSSERESNKYPFDIQHRHVIPYKTESRSDFDELRTRITERIKASVVRANAMDRVAENDRISPQGGLTQQELAVLASIAASVGSPDGCETLWSIRHDLEKSGLTSIAFQLGLRRLKEKGLVEDRVYQGEYETSEAAAITEKGWQWIDENESLFVLRRPQKSTARTTPDDDIPF